MQGLIGQIELDIVQTEKRLACWRQQLQAQGDTELGERVSRIIAGYEVQLDQLREALKLVDA
jgi:hypothetical protein